MKNKNTKNHFDIIDVTRGFAILLMFIYHFCYDLDYFGYIQQNFNQDDFWINFRSIIVTLFLIVMGISLYLASYKNVSKNRFLKRLALLIFYSLLVSASSWVMFPQAMISFGILHFITIASILGLFFVHFGIFNLFIGILLIAASQLFQFELFDSPTLQWLGFTTKLPVAVDYVPLIPWFGVVLIGMYLGQFLPQLPKESFIIRWKNTHAISKLFALGGRHSLHIYMLHQPLFLGILYIINQMFI